MEIFLLLRFIDLSVMSTKFDTAMVLICVVILEFFILISFPTSFKEREKTFWYRQDAETEQDLPYNKKNLIQKWFLCGTKGRVPIVIRIIYIIKNIVAICSIAFMLIHIIVYKHILSNIARISLFVWIALVSFVSIWCLIRKNIKQYTNKR